jgi:predicted transglutaminase-like cysteine proteinase
MGKTTHAIGRLGACLLVANLLIGGGCASTRFAARPSHYDYFAQPDARDPWSRKIELWQTRQRASVRAVPDADGRLAPVSEPGGLELIAGRGGDLRSKYDSFRAERKRELAREVASWIQAQAQEHYVADGPIDHWATLQETLETNGDDCDGLELLVYQLLLDLGFAPDEVFRAIVYRRTDGQHHMVTLWFEDPEDPWVIDPTGAMTSGMPRMSKLQSWVPLKLFTEDRDFTVHEDLSQDRIARN